MSGLGRSVFLNPDLTAVVTHLAQLKHPSKQNLLVHTPLRIRTHKLMYLGTCLPTHWKSEGSWLMCTFVCSDTCIACMSHVPADTRTSTHMHASLHVCGVHIYGPAGTCTYTHTHALLPARTHTVHIQVRKNRLTNPGARPVNVVNSGPKKRREEQTFLAAQGHLEVKTGQFRSARRGAGQHSDPDAPSPAPISSGSRSS